MKSLQAALGLVTIAVMHPQNAMLETSPELCSARPRTGEPNETYGCTEATTPDWPHFHVHSINASVGPSPDEATTATWRYQRNQQYSITAVTTSSGSVAERYAYTAYGQPTILDGSGSVLSSSAINNRYTYTGREWDQTLGLYHFRARWMSGLAGRFLQRDPIGYADGVNSLVHHVVNSPFRFVDPSGRSLVLVCGGGGVLVGGVWIYRNDPPGSYDWLTWDESSKLSRIKIDFTTGLNDCRRANPGGKAREMMDAISDCPIIGKFEDGGSPDGDNGTSLTYDPGWAWSTKVILSNDFFGRGRCSQYQTLLKECYQRAYLRDFDDTGISDNRSNKNFEGVECCTGCCGTINRGKWPEGNYSCCDPPSDCLRIDHHSPFGPRTK
ncbi:RHS repeat domain-containing protein [Pirellulaceae bacterium SH501]